MDFNELVAQFAQTKHSLTMSCNKTLLAKRS